MKDISLMETIKESFARVVYTHKAHEVMIDQLSDKSKRINLTEIILIAISASGITVSISSRTYNEEWIRIVSALLGFLSLAISLYKINFNAELKMLSHRVTANKLWIIREYYINLISDFSENRIDSMKAMLLRDDLQNKLKEVYDNSLQVNSSAYSVAQIRLKEKEDFSFRNEEINKFLPPSLQN